MSRGRFPVRPSIPEIDPIQLAHYRQRWLSKPLYETPDSFPPLTTAGFFGASGPLSLELGCGMGHFLTELAARNPADHFLGIDIGGATLEFAATLADQRGLANIRFLIADITLLGPKFEPNSLRNVYLHFPVPCRAGRDRNRQIYAPAILSRIETALVPDGRLHLMTDDPGVAQTMQIYVNTTSLPEVSLAESHLVLDDDLKSPFHRRWEAKGRRIWRWELRKP